MILYCLGHAATVVKALVHRSVYHSDEGVILIVPEGTQPFANHNKKYEGIAQYITAKMYYGSDMINMTEEEIMDKINEYVEGKLSNCIADIRNISDIYVTVDVKNPFTIYFEKNKIEYSIIEMSANLQYNRYYLKTEDTPYERLYKKMGTRSCVGSYCKKVYLDAGTVELLNMNREQEVFNYSEGIDNLSEKDLQQILSIYDSMIPDFVGKVDVFFPNSTKYIMRKKKKNKYEMALLPSQILVDYYLYEYKNLVIKPHPNELYDYSYLFPEHRVWSKGIPSELFRRIRKINFGKCFFVNTTSAQWLSDICDEAVIIGRNYYDKYFYLHLPPIFYLSFMINALPGEVLRVSTINIPIDQVEIYHKLAFPNINVEYCDKYKKDDANNLVIVNMNKVSELQVLDMINSLNDTSTIALINNKRGFSGEKMGDVRISKRFVCIDIKYTKIKETTFLPFETDCILLYSNNNQLRLQLYQMVAQKVLPCTGVEIAYIPTTEEECKHRCEDICNNHE